MMGVLVPIAAVATALVALLLAWPVCAKVLTRAGASQRFGPSAYAACAATQGGAIGLGLTGACWIAAQAGFPLPLVAIGILLAIAAAWSAWRAVKLVQEQVLPRRGFETVALGILQACTAASVAVTIGIVFTVLSEAWHFFTLIPVTDFLFGLDWSPQIAIRADQAGASGSFGMIPVLLGTILISVIAMLVAAPLGLLSAIYLSEFASERVRNHAKPALEFLAGIPTVVYGFFALVTLSPIMHDLGNLIGVKSSGESAITAGLVIGIMTIPFVASLAEDALHAVPTELRNGSLALGSTHGEATLRVALPAALPGIMAGFLLALSRALGETMIVVMAAGLAANLTVNPFEAVTTVTVQIVTLLTGDQTFDDPKTLAAFALGLLLFVFTLLLNVVALALVRRYQERYE